MNLQNLKKKSVMTLVAGLALGTMLSAPIAAHAAETASESVLKLKSLAESYSSQGEKLFNEGNFEEAGKAYKNAAKEAKTNDRYWYQAGVAFYKAEKFGDAADCIKKAVELKPDDGDYNKWLGAAYYQQLLHPHLFSSLFGARGTLEKRAEKYTRRAVELIPNDTDAQIMAGLVEEKIANRLIQASHSPSTYIFPGVIEKVLTRAYEYYQKAVEIDPSKTKNIEQLNRFAQQYSQYGFHPYIPQTSTPEGTQGVSVPATSLNDPASLQADANQMQKWMEDGQIKVYNAGAGFEWWNEESRKNFEALPFSDDIEEVASHVYRVVWRDESPEEVDYVVIVPRHMRIHYGGGEEDVFDSLHIVRVANKGYDENHVMQFTPRASIWANMYDLCYIKNGRTHDVFHWSAEEEFTWNWLEEGKKEVEESTGGAIVLSGAEETYTFEATNNPNVWILHGEKDYGDYKNTWTGKMEALPGVVTPPISIPTEE